MDNNRYNIILNRLIASENNLTPQKLKEYENRARKMAYKSSRHHYIPQYYIKGFAGDDGLLSVYDKQLDIILKKRVGTNGVFFENDRNTIISHDNPPISTIEDDLYSQVDAKFSNCIKVFRDMPVKIAIEDEDSRDTLSAFLLDLFWRNPITDNAFNTLMDNATVDFYNNETKEKYKDTQLENEFRNDPIIRKLERAKMMTTAIKAIIEDRQLQPHVRKLREFKQVSFVLGDYPILYHKTPRTHSDNLASSFFLPISSYRIYSEHKTDIVNFNTYDAYAVNALIIEQSRKIICSAKHDVLEKSVYCYKRFKEARIFDYVKCRVFDGVNNDLNET